MNKTAQDVTVFTISQITHAIKDCLEKGFASIWLQGEVSNFKKHTSGHFYFSLKDADAQISAAMFRGSAQTLQKIPKDGDQVIVYGAINVYPPSGKYQIVVQELRLAGVGELLLKLEELKQKLQKRGWFNKERKRTIPKFPKRIGVVTSPTGAAIQDILNILTRRFSSFHLILNPVKVQGEGAAEEIAAAIRQFNQHQLVDVMIVGRGGGSIEDLWAFNEEKVAQAIFESHIPIICAVGHETDHCIAEYVADVRAPTPSAAAELVCAEKSQHLEFLSQLKRRLTHTLVQTVRHSRAHLEGVLRHPHFRSPYSLLGPWMQRLDDLRQGIDHAMKRQIRQHQLQLEGKQRLHFSLKPLTQIAHFRHKLDTFSIHLNRLLEQEICRKKESLAHLTSTLRSIDPKNLLKKGYSILLDEKEGSAITTVTAFYNKQKLRLLLSDGEATATINQVTLYE